MTFFTVSLITTKPLGGEGRAHIGLLFPMSLIQLLIRFWKYGFIRRRDKVVLGEDHL